LRDAAIKMNERCGDGITSAVVLAQAIIRGGIKNLTAGADAMALKRGIARTVKVIVEELKKNSIEVKTKEQMTQVATISAVDKEVGELIGEVVERVGKDGMVDLEESDRLGLHVEYVEGLKLDRGYTSPYFISSPGTTDAVVEEPYILIADMDISALSHILPALERIQEVGSKNFVLIANDVTGEALKTLVANKLSGTVNCMAVKAPGFDDRRKARLQDAAIFTGGNLISEELGRRLDLITITDFGRAEKVVADAESCYIIGGRGSAEDIKARVEQIKTEIAQANSDFALEKLRERLARLAGRAATLKLGAVTEIELKEKKHRVENALAATLGAVEEGMVPGWRHSPTLNCIPALEKLRQELEGYEATGVSIVMGAL